MIYEVFSPEFTTYSHWYPPETDVCYALIEAESSRDALVIAVKMTEFKPWVNEQRSDGHPPFMGLTARVWHEDV